MRSSAGIALLTLCGNVVGVRVPIPEFRNSGLVQREPEPGLDKRITCIEDDYLLSFQMYIEDSYPSCSAYLGIPETTTFTTATARTTVVVLQTTYQTIQQQVTVPAGTRTVTTTVPNMAADPTLKKRQAGVTPAAAVFSQCAEATGLNASLIHSVSSACSCLFITEKVNVVVTTSTQTRTESGIDYEQTTDIATITGPETTVYYTVKPTTSGPNSNATISSGASPVPDTTSINTNLPSSSTGEIGSPSLSGGGRGGSDSSTGSSPTGIPSISVFGNSTAITLPIGTVTSSQPSSSSTAPNITSSAGMPPSSSAQPSQSIISLANSSLPVGTGTVVSSSALSVFSTITLRGSTTVVVSPSTGLPSAPSNASTTTSASAGSPTIPTGPRGGSSITPSGSAFPSAISSAIYPIGNSTLIPSSTGTSGLPTRTTGVSNPSDCPANNGTIYTSQCQNFLIECYINYGGPIEQGLVERSLYGCVDDCAVANVGFSQSRCYAASYYPNIVGPNCFFKTQNDSLTPLHNELTVSALLLNTNAGNASALGCSARPSSSNATSKLPISTGGTSVPVRSATGGSLTLSGSATTANATSIPFPSFSSAAASGSKPSLSRNATSVFSTGTMPLSSGTVPSAQSTRPFSTGTVPTLPAGNSTTAKPTGPVSGTAPLSSLSLLTQTRLNNMTANSTTVTPPATSCQSCTSYVYSTSVIFTTSTVYDTYTGSIPVSSNALKN